MKNKIVYSGKISGALYENAKKYLSRELSFLEEQKKICYEANQLYSRIGKAYRKFEKTGRLSDALYCARLRG